MTLQDFNGAILDVYDWNMVQADIAGQWTETDQLNIDFNGRIMIWAAAFARSARKICDHHGVHVDTFARMMPGLQERLRLYMDQLQYYLGEAAHAPVPFTDVIEKICFEVIPLVDENRNRIAVELRLLLPPVQDGANGRIESCMFPIYATFDFEHRSADELDILLEKVHSPNGSRAHIRSVLHQLEGLISA